MLRSRSDPPRLLCRALLHELGGEPPLRLVRRARPRPVEVAAHLASLDRCQVTRRIRPRVQRPAQPRRGHLNVVRLRPDCPRDAGRQRHGRAEQRRPAHGKQRQDVPRLLVLPEYRCPLLLPSACLRAAISAGSGEAEAFLAIGVVPGPAAGDASSWVCGWAGRRNVPPR